MAILAGIGLTFFVKFLARFSHGNIQTGRSIFCTFQMSTNVAQDLVVTVERVRIFREATDASAEQDFLENTVRSVGTLFIIYHYYYLTLFIHG